MRSSINMSGFFSLSRFCNLMLLSSVYLRETYFHESLKCIFLSWSFALFKVCLLNFFNNSVNILIACFTREAFYERIKMLKSEILKHFLTMLSRHSFVLFTILVQKTTITTTINISSKDCLYVYNTKVYIIFAKYCTYIQFFTIFLISISINIKLC